MPPRPKASKDEPHAPEPVPEPAEPQAAEPEPDSETIGQETHALLSVAQRLEKVSENFSRQQKEYEQVRGMQADIQNVLGEIMRGIENASLARTTEAAQAALERPPAKPGSPAADGGPCECDCTSSGCCCFNIKLDKIRGIQPQGLLEFPDSGDTTVPAPTINELEVRLFASVGKRGILLPSLSTTMGIRVPSVLAGGGPGLWMTIDRVIERVCLPRGTTQEVTVEFDATEVDEGAERPLGMKDEHGCASGTLLLDCCMSRINPTMPADLYFTHGGLGGGNPGAISIAFYAERVCC